ncbi:MAG: hypothetical protein ABR567_02290 [Myxococcales bacterium]
MFAWVIALHLPLATLQGVPLSDDVFTSDLLDGEWPMRVAIGRSFASGQGTAWLSGIYGGFPALAGGAGADPLTLFWFSWLPPTVALDLFVLSALLLVACGTYRVARALGASRLGAVLAGAVFVQSGVVVSQLRHLGILAALAWFPWALWALIRAMTRHDPARWRPTARRLALFALFFGLQWLTGFPQLPYACALAYAAFALVLAFRRQGALPLLASAASACVVAALIGSAQLLPQLELASLSDRASGVSAEFAVRYAYAPSNAWQFLVPYVNGDISNRTYRGTGIFWEDFGYAGVGTLLLAFAARRQRTTWLLAGVALFAFLLVLGPATPVFPLAFRIVPGMSVFRLPTRFLFLVDFALALLAALGLARFERRRWAAFGLVGLIAFDVGWFNSRQNAVDAASEWSESPATVKLFDRSAPFRTFTPASSRLHKDAFTRASGWSGDLTPYHQMRMFLQPDSNVAFGIETGDGYAGIAPRWCVDVWGDHNRPGLMPHLYQPDAGGLAFSAAFFRVVGMQNVRYLITAQPIAARGVRPVGSAGPARVYEVEAWLPRARLVPRTAVLDDRLALQRLAAVDFDPRTDVLLDRTLDVPGGGTGTAAIVEARNDRVTIETSAAAPSTLVLADTWYPGWEAAVDGSPAVIARANVSQRAVAVPAGRHTVRFVFRSKPVRRGVWLTLAGLGLVALALLWRSRA